MKSVALAMTIVGGFGTAYAQQLPAPNMSFFVTSKSQGRGGDLGGLEGADRHCQALAEAVGAGSKTWRAYLSTQATNNAAVVNARDRIGTGPWYNSKGVQVAANLEELHSENFYKINKTTALDENGNFINGRGDTPNHHDISHRQPARWNRIPRWSRQEHATTGRAAPRVVLSSGIQT